VSQDQFDKDLRSMQDARRLVERSRIAQREFASASAAKVDAVCEAMAEAAYQAAASLAAMAHEETGYGNAEHKTIKNQHASRGVWESIREMPTVGIIERDAARKIVTMAEPVGVIAALTPTTNPTSTAIYKAMIAVKGRNSIVISPHPSAARCTAEAVRIISAAADRAGAPAGLVSCMEEVSLAGTQELIRHYGVNLILATGGGPMVRAAHSVGKPAYGVGPGNVPAWVDRSADLRKAAQDLVASKSFDCSLICATEQSVVADAQIAPELRRLMEAEGAHWLNEQEVARMSALLFHPDGAMNTDWVGKSARVLAQAIDMQVVDTTKVLVAPLAGIGRAHALSREKLTTVLGFITASTPAEGLALCQAILKFGGDGHTAVLHSRNEEQVENMAALLPAFRIVVNSMSTLGSVGRTCGFSPSFTLGTGGIGGAISGDNITATHLINRKRVGWEISPWLPAVQTTPNADAEPAPDIDDVVSQVLARLRQSGDKAFAR
jgi:acetaldehyde dehydrogenase (acetylating)